MQRRYRGSRGYLRQRTALAVAVAACFAGNFALANPTGPAVAQGQASFATQGNTLTVTNAPGTVINWQGFSIAGNEIARFIQQSQSSSVLNRVVGINPSSILGSLQSNGRVFLVNPNGITIGPGASIDVAGFMASTLNLSDADFLAGRMRFTPASGAGGVVNQGTITTAGGGMVYLVGQDVQNSGIIRSPQGEILLAAGKSVELVDAQTPEVRVQLTAPDNQALNLGQLIATGGRIGMYGTLVKHSGVANATTAALGENGKIVFRAVKDVTLDAGSVTAVNGPQGGSVVVQAETGTASLSGIVEAKGETGAGGAVQVLGNQVGLFGHAGINVSGQAGGGTVLIGGDFQGGNPDVQNAWRTYLGVDATVRADAVQNGNGGKVIVWSNDVTRGFGAITARGGAQSGNGGFVEVSGKQGLVYAGSVNTLAPFGVAGLLLLDPADLDIVATGNVDVNGNSPFAPLGGDGAVSTLGWDTITGSGGLGGGLVVITTVGTPTTTGETGRIRIQAAGTYNSANSLTINAASGIEVNAAVTNNGTGALTLDAQGGVLNVAQALTTTGGDINLSGSTGISLGANVSSGGGAIFLNNAVTVTAANPALTAGAGNISFASTINGGTNSLTTDNTGTLTFGGAISSMANLTIQGGSSGVALPQTTLTGSLNLTSSGNITQSGAVTAPTLNLNADTNAITATLTTTGNDFGTVSLAGVSGGTFTSASVTDDQNAMSIGGNAVTLSANAAGALTLTGGSYTTLNATSGTSIGQSGAALQVSGLTTADAGTGTIALTDTNNDFTGAVTLNASGTSIAIQDVNSLTLGAPTLHGANTAITAIAGTTLTLPVYNYSTGTGSIDFQSSGGTLVTKGTLTTTTGGISLTGSSGITLAHNLTTAGGDIALLSPVTLGNSVSLISGGGDIGVLSITGTTASAQNLTLNAGSGDIGITGDVGATRLGSLTVTSGDVVQFQGAGTQQVSTLTVTQSTDTSFAGAVNVSNGITLAAAAGNVSFLNGLTTGTASTLATTGTLQVGNATADTSSIAGGFSRGAGLQTVLAGDITVSGAVSLSDTAIPAGQVATINSGANPVTFNATVEGPGGLIVNSGGATTFSGQVGAVTPLSGITTNAAGTTVISGGLMSTDGLAGQTYNDPVSIGVGPANTVFLSGANDVTFNQTLTGNGGDITFGSSVASLGNLQVVGALTNVDDFDVFAASASVNSGSNNAINRVAFNTSGNVSHFDQGGILLDTSTVGGTLILSADTGSITQTGVVSVGGAATISTNRGSITTGGAGIGFTAASATFTASDGLGNDTGTLTVGAGGIAATAPGGAIVLKAADGISINGSVITNNGNITLASGNTAGMASLGMSLAANAGGTALGSVAINAPVRAGNGDITIYSSGPVSQFTGAGNDAGLQSRNALTVRTYNDTAGAATITLNNDNNAANSVVPVSPSGCTGIATGHGAGNCALQITLETRQAGDPGVSSLTAFPGGFASSQISYKSISGTQIIGIGTASDVLLEADSWSLGAGAINGRNVNIVATGSSGGGNIDVGIAIPTTYINNNQTGGSLNLVAARDINLLPAGAIGAAATRFDHNLVLAAGNDINLQGSIYLSGNLNLRANALAADLFGNAPLGTSGSVTMTTPGTTPLEVRAANITLGTAARPVNNFTMTSGSAATGQQADALLAADDSLDINLAGNFNITAGTAAATVPSAVDTSADAIVRGGATSVIVGGNLNMTGGSASIASGASASQSADASAILEGTSLSLKVSGGVALAGGTAFAATGGNTATANAQIVSHAAFSPEIQGNLTLTGGTATAQPIPSQIANAVAAARFESDGDLLLKVTGNANLQAGTATSINTGGGAFAEADAGAVVRSKAKISLLINQDLDITGGSASATGSNLRAIASAGVFTGNIAAGESLLITTAGDMSLTGGTATGAAADAAALIYSSAEAKLNIGGPTGLRMEGGTGPFFPPFDSGVFTPNSDFFHLIGGDSLIRILGDAYPITITGSITLVANPALGAALFISEAPPLSLDSLLAAFIKTTDCVSFSGGACTLSSAVASGSGKGKDPAGGVCK